VRRARQVGAGTALTVLAQHEEPTSAAAREPLAAAPDPADRRQRSIRVLYRAAAVALVGVHVLVMPARVDGNAAMRNG
jgi:hypothetical protein